MSVSAYRLFACKHGLLRSIQLATCGGQCFGFRRHAVPVGQRLARNEADIHLWCQEVSATTPPLDAVAKNADQSHPTEHTPGLSAEAALSQIMTTFAQQGIDVFFIDRTRPEFAIPVVRAIAPGLCIDKPRWGNARLLAPDLNDVGPVEVSTNGLSPNMIPLRV